MVMKKYTKHLLPVVLSGLMSLISTSASAGNPQRAGQAGAQQLLINPWAKSAGWGGVNIANVEGVEATFLNVAGLASTTSTEFSFSNTQWFGDININAFGFAQKVGDTGVLGITVTAFDFGDITRTTEDLPDGTLGTYTPSMLNIGLSYAKKFTDNISGGVTARIISESTPDMSATGFSLDAGVQYTAGEQRQMKFGISIKNVGPVMKYEGDGDDLRLPNVYTDGQQYEQTFETRAAEFELPSLLNIGVSYDFLMEDHRVTTAGSFTSNSFTKDNFTLGAEYGYKSYLALRVGYMIEEGIFNEYTEGRTTAFTGLNGGVTFELPIGEGGKSFALDYAYRAADPLSSPHSIGARFNL